MKALVVDDELSSRLHLIGLLQSNSSVEVAGEAETGCSALRQIQTLRPELVVLNTDLPDVSGFDVLRSIAADIPKPLVVFVTGHDGHALDAFSENALAYLIKPVDPERLAIAVDRAVRICASEKQAPVEPRGEEYRDGSHVPLSLVVGRKHDHCVLLRPDEVKWFQVQNGIVHAYGPTESYWVNYQLAELEDGLLRCGFFRARRSVLINLQHVQDIKPFARSSFVLTMNDSRRTQIQVSERQAKALRQRIPGL